MPCKSCHATSPDKECQNLSGWESLSLPELQKRCKEFTDETTCYVYTVRTTRRLGNNVVCHWGSGPNLEGGLGTLCTCKHDMRLGRSHSEWPDTWIVGLTSRSEQNGFEGRHYLFYVMRVQWVLSTHKELFEFLTHEYPAAVDAKRTDKNRLGDIFRPKAHTSGEGGWLNPSSYIRPVVGHSHSQEGERDAWHDDISSQDDDGRFSSIPLLVGDPKMTFVWREPMIQYRGHRNVGEKSSSH